jgi:predicted DCC family thiol-disulfide oxidoreductase YuxK
VNAEITDNKGDVAANVIFYDDACAFCLAWVRNLGPLLTRRGFTFAPLSGERFEIRVQFADGIALGGADAIVALARRIWWAWPLWLLAKIPGAMPFLRAAYGVVARNRHCLGGACVRRKRVLWLDCLPLVILPTITLFTITALPPWVFMWLFAFSIFLACKWLAWRRANILSKQASSMRLLGYWLAWPGMDANEFLHGQTPAKPTRRTWLAALTKTIIGAVLLLTATSNVFPIPPAACGWLGMGGIILLLHFGTFHLLALFWQTNGIPAEPVMRAPLLATSLANFWGARWNTAFNALAHDLAFRPLARKVGIAGATLGTFVISGLIHDLVISVPARAGFGLPTAYFTLQGAAVLFERSNRGRTLGLGRGWRGWLFMFAFTAAPAYWLFHPPFIHNVILPMLQVIGATLHTL